MGTCPAGFPYAQWRDRVCNFGEVAEAKRRLDDVSIGPMA